jgi:nucleotide-binding universal stress UspA family protein
MKSAPAAVGVFVDRGFRAVKRVLVPHLGREHDLAALAVAKRIATSADAHVTVLHVLSPGGGPPLDIGDVGQNVEVVTIEDASPVDAAARESANGYDLVVIGIGEAWGLEHRSFGLRTEAVLRSCATSVLVVRGPVGEAAESSPARFAAHPEASAAS